MSTLHFYFCELYYQGNRKNSKRFYIKKHSLPKTLYYKNCGLQNVDIFFKILSIQCLWVIFSSKISSLQYLWVKRLSSELFHEWIMIPLYFRENVSKKSLKFHSNLDFKNSILKHFSFYYHKVFANWKSLFHSLTIVISCIRNQFLEYNRYGKINSDVSSFEKLPEKGRNFLMQLFDEKKL